MSAVPNAGAAAKMAKRVVDTIDGTLCGLGADFDVAETFAKAALVATVEAILDEAKRIYHDRRRFDPAVTLNPKPHEMEAEVAIILEWLQYAVRDERS